jgi:hypothetical protein
VVAGDLAAALLREYASLRAAVDGLHGAAAAATAAADAKAMGDAARLHLDLLWAEHGRLHERLAATGALLARVRSLMPIPAAESTAWHNGDRDGHGGHVDDLDRGVGGRVASHGGGGVEGSNSGRNMGGDADNADDGGSDKTVCRLSATVSGRTVGSGLTSSTAAQDHNSDRLGPAQEGGGAAQAEDLPVADESCAMRLARQDWERSNGDGDHDGGGGISAQARPSHWQAWWRT